MKKSSNALVYVRRVLGDRRSAISSLSKSRWAISLRDRGDAAMVESSAKVIIDFLSERLCQRDRPDCPQSYRNHCQTIDISTTLSEILTAAIAANELPQSIDRIAIDFSSLVEIFINSTSFSVR
jgi:hypothetical protein